MLLSHNAQHTLVYTIDYQNLLMQLVLLPYSFLIGVGRKLVILTLRNYVANSGILNIFFPNNFSVFEWLVLVLWYDASVLIFCLMNQGRTKGKGWSTANKLKPPSNFIAGRPKAALLFWFYGDFRFVDVCHYLSLFLLDIN